MSTTEPTLGEVTIVTAGPRNFVGRFLFHLRLLWQRGILFALLSGMLGLCAWGLEPSLPSLLAALLFIPSIGVGTCLVRAALPNPHVAALPRAVTFRPDSIRVAPSVGEAFETSWTWVRRAYATSAGTHVVLEERPRLEIHLEEATVGRERYSVVQGWLERHGKIR